MKLVFHEGDKESWSFPIHDSVTKLPITTNDVTAATFVAKFGTLIITLTLGSGIEAALVGGNLRVTVTVPTTETEKLSDSGVVLDGAYQFRVTRGSIGPETLAEGTAEGVKKLEGG